MKTLAAEMEIRDGLLVWRLYHLAHEEARALAGSEPAVVVAQEPDGGGAWHTLARLPATGPSFGVRSGRTARRIVFLGDYDLDFVARAVAAEASGLERDVEVVSAFHSRHGDVKKAVLNADGYDRGLAAGDTLTIRYGPSPRDVPGALDGFLWVTAPGTRLQIGGRRGAGTPGTKVVPAMYGLAAQGPNPFAHSTALRFALPRNEHVELHVFDLLGRRVRTLASDTFEAGEHSVPWDGRDASGTLMPAGVYHVRIQAGEFRAQRTMVLLPLAR